MSVALIPMLILSLQQPTCPSAGRTTKIISACELETRLSIVADDSMAGRAAGSVGALKTEDYLERELRRLGVRPAGERGTYEQSIPTILRRVGESNLASKGQTFRLWADYAPIPWPWRVPELNAAVVVFGGVLGDDALDSSSAAGKFVILRQPVGRSVFPRISPRDRLHLARVVAVVGLEDFAPGRLDHIKQGLDAGVQTNSLLADSAPVSLIITTAMAEALLDKPLDAARAGDTGDTIRGTVQIADSVVTICCNILGIVPGRDRRVAGQFVALGAHLDHIGVSPVAVDHDSTRAANTALWARKGRLSSPGPPSNSAGIPITTHSRSDSIYNGADDDGSGSAALLEVAEALVAEPIKPRRSVLFVWHTAEELGDEGSTWFTAHPTVALDSIVAQLNLDMIGRGSATDIAGGGPAYLQVIGSRRLSRQLGDVIERANRRADARFHLDYRFDAPDDPNGFYCRSDHYLYAQHGIPIAFFTTGEHPDYHQVTDEVRYIDFAHLARVTHFVFDVVKDLGNMPARLRRDRGAVAASCG